VRLFHHAWEITAVLTVAAVAMHTWTQGTTAYCRSRDDR
jgi:hypothetical protein